MKKIIGSVLAVMILAGMAYAFAAEGGVASSWRYKMTVIVETPEGLKTGSAVREITFTKPKPGFSPRYENMSVKGEAVTVDLGKRGVLFALLGVDYVWQIVYRAFPFTDSHGHYSASGHTTEEMIEHYSRLKSGKAVLTVEQYPPFVRFRDLNDPKTVENLLDMKSCPDAQGVRDNASCLVKDHFEEFFGQGVRLKEVVVEITDEPITTGTIKLLPWLPDYYDQRLDGDRFGYSKAKLPLANSLSSGSFSTGESLNER